MWDYILANWPFLLIMVCCLGMHLFMNHGSHDNHDKHDEHENHK